MSSQPVGASLTPPPRQEAGSSEAGQAPRSTGLASRIVLTLPPDWRYVRPLRDYVNELAQALGKPREFADRCAMCTSELLENAVKYALEHTGIQVVVEMGPDTEVAQVTVENQASAERIADLMRVLGTVNSGGPFESYIFLLSQAAAKEGATSQVGLGRIRAEGSAWIRCDRLDERSIRLTVGIPEKRGSQTASDVPPPSSEG